MLLLEEPLSLFFSNAIFLFVVIRISGFIFFDLLLWALFIFLLQHVARLCWCHPIVPSRCTPHSTSLCVALHVIAMLNSSDAMFMRHYQARRGERWACANLCVSYADVGLWVTCCFVPARRLFSNTVRPHGFISVEIKYVHVLAIKLTAKLALEY
jgi:hypothetical protein